MRFLLLGCLLLSAGCATQSTTRVGKDVFPQSDVALKTSAAVYLSVGGRHVLKDAMFFAGEGVTLDRPKRLDRSPESWAIRWRSEAGPFVLHLVLKNETFLDLYDPAKAPEQEWNDTGLGKHQESFSRRTPSQLGGYDGGLEILLQSDGSWRGYDLDIGDKVPVAEYVDYLLAE